MKAWTIVTVFLAMALCSGCQPVSPESNSPKAQPAAEYHSGGKIVLGAPVLTAGIPGNGPLTIEQIRGWLEDPDVHRELDFTLPWALRDAISLIWMPPENPLTRAKIELGRQLFFDVRLTKLRFACASCHIPEQDYSAYMVMPDIGRNPPVCFNRIFSERQLWDGRVKSLEEQPGNPISNPFEMGTTTEEYLARIQSIQGYQLQFDTIFGRTDMAAVGFALACFQRALVTGPAPWDYHRLLAEFDQAKLDSLAPEDHQRIEKLRAKAMDNPMSESAIRGEAIFFSDRARCSWCHSGPNFTDEEYHNVGIGMDQEEPDLGRFEFTENDEDIGAFKTPTLRNIANTPPYMHNGQFGRLEKVIDWFNRGGFVHTHLDSNIRPLKLTRDEKRDLMAFLESLSGLLPQVEKDRLPQ